MNNISAPRHVITGGTISATYPDNARIIISDNAEVSFSALTIGSGCTFVLGQFCTVTINATATVGSNTQIILQPGSTLTVASGASLQLSTSCLLDITLGKLNLNGLTPLNFGSESILRIGNIPISGSGTISGPEFVEDYVIQKFAFLEAKCTFAFNGVDIDGNWHMDRACPQWFAAPGCEDWSEPINKAIKLKRTGEVFLQRGVYPTKHSIRVRYGIELVGENGFISNPGKGSNSDLLGTTIVANKNSSSCSNFQSGYMVLVNTKPVEQYPSSPEPIEEQFNMWVHPYPAFTTVVRNITFMNGDKSERIIPQLNGLFTAGGLDIEQCRFLNFKQAIVKSRDYADGFVIKDCRFSGVNIVHYAPPGTTSATDTTVYDTKWMIYLNGDGDNLQFTGNAFMGSRFLNNRTLYVGQNRGGLISCNITGGEIVLNGCRGLTFSNNHMESSMESNEGMLIHVLNSQVTISDNFFYKSERSNIIITGTAPGLQSIVELHNNCYLCVFQNPFVNLKDKYNIECAPKDNTNIDENEVLLCKYTHSLNDAIDYWTKRSATPEILIGHDATVIMTNQYRQISTYRSLSWISTVGIQFGTIYTDSDHRPIAGKEQILNNLAPFLSCGGTIKSRIAINSLFSTQRSINKRLISMSPNKNERWYGEKGTYSYEAIFIMDRQRSIVADVDNNFRVPIYYYNSESNEYTELLKKNRSFKPELSTDDNSEFFSTFISLHNYGAGEPWCGYLRLIRTRTYPKKTENETENKTKNENDTPKDYHTVDIPISNALIIYDNGIFIAGYKWRKIESIEEISINPPLFGIEDVTHTNETVECNATTKPTSLPDTWNRGDKIFNVGTETDWNVIIKK
jgi:hypothetical protein